MIRHYYLSNDLTDVKEVESDLLRAGFTLPQLHVLTGNDAGVQQHQLNEVESVLKKDVIRSTEMGALIGIIGAILVLACAYMFNWTATAAGWMPFIFLAIVVLGFCTWEGGFIGIQRPNAEFSRFQKTLKAGKHIFFVDALIDQQVKLNRIMNNHPNLIQDVVSNGAPDWIVKSQDNYNKVMKTMP